MVYTGLLPNILTFLAKGMANFHLSEKAPTLVVYYH